MSILKNLQNIVVWSLRVSVGVWYIIDASEKTGLDL